MSYNIKSFNSSIDKSDSERVLDILSVIIFILYLVVLLWLISLKCNSTTTILKSYRKFYEMTSVEKISFMKNSFISLFQKSTWLKVWRNPTLDILNIIVFIPFGVYLSYFSKNLKLLKTIIAAFLLSFTVEIVQLVTNTGGFSAVDLVTNTLGGVLGYPIYAFVFRDDPDHVRNMNIVSCFILIVFLGFAGFAVYNTYLSFDFYVDVLLKRYQF